MSPDISPELLRIDLNADLGEGVTDDAGLLEVVSSANVACGFHAGDARVMAEVCERSVVRGVVIGAQVSYADREGFGRRPMDVDPEILSGWVAEQIALLTEAAAAAGTRVSYVRAHGALYNRIADDPDQADAFLLGSGALAVLGLPGSTLAVATAAAGRRFVGEAFPDRGYTADGRLVPRGSPGALVTQPAAVAANAARLAAEPGVESLCLHGDSPGAVRTALAVRAGLQAAGYVIQAVRDR
ncbi:MAG: LamB/YcsF family protein [Propionibacteriales bacterium]|nr:LamB/YcsF family protein [Propionibacteriales bacterium]